MVTVNSSSALSKTYQVTDELIGIGGKGIRRQSHTKGEATLGLGGGSAPCVEDNAGARVSEGVRERLGRGRRQHCEFIMLVSPNSVSDSLCKSLLT